jgi:hypothetical protein
MGCAVGRSAALRSAVSALVVVGLLAACGGATSSPLRTSTPRPTATIPVDAPTDGVTEAPTSTASAVPWPAGWDSAFCLAYTDIVVAQELARDIGRALDDDDEEDAIGLAHELGGVVAAVRTLIDELPPWEGSQRLLDAIDEMLADDEQLVTFYLRYLEESRDGALQRARDVEETLRENDVPRVEAALLALAEIGLTCPGQSFSLDKP